ncbi:hypothetical protein [Cognatilysobacter lacus]|uniref:hypothetical protein n=1 Tax=Cognatilysobacter lacus TaxID=1643323 RepID=UPI00165A0E58|nr:hypothetical protein [Lysobacter lacus]
MPSRRLFLALTLLVAGAALADPPDDRHGASARPVTVQVMAHESSAQERSLAESVRRVERATGGQILSAERVPFDGRDVNRIKVLDQTGRVRVITEDPQRRPPRGDDD